MRGLSLGLMIAVALLLAGGAVSSAPALPQLTGRVVDQAQIIPADIRAGLETKLSDLETKSGIQLVVATVSSLQGEEIEPFANELFRFWKLGERRSNNGVLLLVAPTEKRVRIEVGYGLEGTLTDALSKVIITNSIAPAFKAGNFGTGIQNGVADIMTVLTTDTSEWEKRPSLRVDAQTPDTTVNWFIVALAIAFVVAFVVSRGFRWFVFNLLASSTMGSRGGYAGGGGFSGGGFSGGGFAGGGGSSGGGGASGSW